MQSLLEEHMSRFSSTAFPNADGSLMLEVTQRRLDAQQSSIDAIDTKVGVAFAVASGLIGILAAVLSTNGGHITVLDWTVTGLAAASFTALALSAFCAMKIQSWATGIEPKRVFSIFRDESVPDEERTWIVAQDYNELFKRNKPQVAGKARLGRVTLRLLLVQTALTVAGLCALAVQV
jgi:hypothetical protein